MTAKTNVELDAMPRTPRVGNPLTARQRQVLVLVATGRTNAQIAAALHLTPDTVSTQCFRIFRKLGVPNRAAAVDRGWRLGLLGPAGEPSDPETARRPA